MKNIRRYCLYFLFSLFALAGNAQLLDDFKKHSTYLSSDKLQGRGRGSHGIHLAARYISDQFEEIGLEKLNSATHFQPFTFPGQEVLEKNVVGFIKAKSPTQKSIVFTAHYDGHGIKKKDGIKDSIYNGARDNAVGVAALIELAREYAKSKPPRVNLVFVATAAEEFGQHGVEHYLMNPVFPTDQVVINLNIDGFNVSGSRGDYFVMPRQGVDFIDEIAFVALKNGWIYNSPDWVDQMNTSFDSSAFLKRGIPAFTLWTGDRLKSGAKAEEITFGMIHSPDDEINDSWNWDGVPDHLGLYKAICDYFMRFSGSINVTDPEIFVAK